MVAPQVVDAYRNIPRDPSPWQVIEALYPRYPYPLQRRYT